MSENYVMLKDVCDKASSNIAQKDLLSHEGPYPIYGASGFIKNVDFFQREEEYIAVVKDGAGIGRTFKLPAQSSVIGTMQYILPKGNIDISYLYYAICAMHLEKYFSGATIPHIYFRDYQKEKLRLPSLDVQKRTAFVLDTIESIIAKRKQQLSKLDELVKSRFIEMFGDISQKSCQWDKKTIGEICLFMKSGLSRKLSDDDIGLPVIRSINIQNGEFVYDNIKYWYIDDPQGADTNKYILDDGDVLINFINSQSQIGKTCIFSDVGRNCIYTTNILRMKLSRACSQYYYLYYTMTHFYNGQLQKIIQPAVNQASFTTTNFQKMIIPLPPLELQNKFADFVKSTDKSKIAIKKSLDELETLKKSLMQQYFG